MQAADLAGMTGDLDRAIVTSSMFWEELVGRTKLSADAIHDIGKEAVKPLGPVTHVRLNIHPDGGVSRLRLFGCLA
jgi:allantoicase